MIKTINIKTIPQEGIGALSFFEAERDFPFPMKRIYYISQVPEGAKRGFHAHKELKQLIFCPYGKVKVMLDNGKEKDELILDNPATGIIIDTPMWREMTWLCDNSVLCVAASEYYTEDDYIRTYDDFIKFQKERGAL